MQLSSIFETVENEIFSSIISKHSDDKITVTWNLIPDTWICLKKLPFAILTNFPLYIPASRYFRKWKIRKTHVKTICPITSSVRILLKVTKYKPDINYLASKYNKNTIIYFIFYFYIKKNYMNVTHTYFLAHIIK